MGKGDKRTAKGKRIMGTYGNSRKKKVSIVVNVPKKKAKPAKAEVEKETPAKKAPAKKTAAKKPAAKKTTTKKTTASKTEEKEK